MPSTLDLVKEGLAVPVHYSKAPINPLDKCTIVSVWPKPIKETKPMIHPSVWQMPAVEVGKVYTDYEISVIGPASWWKEMEPNQPWLEIVTNSLDMAKAWIGDYCKMLGVDGEKMPGLFWVPGKFSKLTVKSYKNEDTGETFESLITKARTMQDNFFKELVRIADIGWARSNGNPLAISDDARLGAELLGTSNKKAWMQDFKAYELINCKACGHMVNPMYPICSNCKAIVNEARAKELNIKFAE
jgi:hypothetical protein